MQGKYNISDYLHHDALIVVRTAEPSIDWEGEIITIIPFDRDYTEDSDSFFKYIDEAASALGNAYAFYPHEYLTVSVIKNHSHVNML